MVLDLVVGFFQPYLGLLISIEVKVLKRLDSLGRESAAPELLELNPKWCLYLKTGCMFAVSLKSAASL